MGIWISKNTKLDTQLDREEAARTPWIKAYFARAASRYTVNGWGLSHMRKFGARVGFVVAEIDVHCIDEPTKKLPGFVLLSGDAVAVLVVVNSEYVLCVNQFRVGALADLTECVAGIIEGQLVGEAAKELRDETGITCTENELKPLGRAFYTSPGRSSECIRGFYVEKEIGGAALNELLRTQHGDEHENIHCRLIELQDFDAIQACQDVKLEVLHARYMRLCA